MLYNAVFHVSCRVSQAYLVYVTLFTANDQPILLSINYYTRPYLLSNFSYHILKYYVLTTEGFHESEGRPCQSDFHIATGSSRKYNHVFVL